MIEGINKSRRSPRLAGSKSENSGKSENLKLMTSHREHFSEENRKRKSLGVAGQISTDTGPGEADHIIFGYGNRKTRFPLSAPLGSVNINNYIILYTLIIIK